MILFFLVLSSLTMKRDQSLVSEDLNLLSKNEGEIRLSELNSENQRLGSEFATWEIEVKTKLNHKRNDIEELWDKTEIKTVKKQQENCMKILQFSFTCWEGQQDVSPNCFATNSVVKFWRKNWSNDESFRHRPPGGGGYSIYPWVGRCGSAPHTLTLFKTKIADFPTLLRQSSDFWYPV